MPFADADSHQVIDATGNKRAADALPAVLFLHGELIDITAPAVVAAQYSTDDSVVIPGDETQARIALQKAR